MKMKNKAKCKLCKSIIESFHSTDYVLCKCGEISIDGGESLKCFAKDWNNFLRIDDQGNEIIVKVSKTEKESSSSYQKEAPKPNKRDLLNMFDEMIKNIESLPQQAMTLPINHYDFCSALLLLSSIFRSDLKDEI